MEKKETNDVVCGFGCLKTYEGQKDFDETYKSVEVKKRVKKVGESPEDFIIEEYEVVTETPIRAVIDAQKDSVGIEAFMKPYIMSGEEIPFVGFDDVNKAPIQDFSKFPDDPITSQDAYKNMYKIWDSLDSSLKGNCKTPEEFLKSFTEEKFNNYIISKLNVGKKEVKKDGD